MPSVSAKQHRFFELVAHNKAASKRLGVPQSVGKDFEKADKGTKLASNAMKKKGKSPKKGIADL
jgi:hypothetical protein